jgi:hypothetical protein
MKHHRRSRYPGHALTTLLAAAALGVVAAAPAPAQDTPRQSHLDELVRLTEEATSLRKQLAACRLAARDAEQELAELRQFIIDHEQLGTDFERYRAVVEIAEREAKRREIEEGRKRREAERAARRERQAAFREQQARENAEESRLDRYRQAGFSSIGLDTFVGRMAYAYQTNETNPTRIDYDPLIGLYYRPLGPSVQIDWGTMTISGSVLNASDEVRNIGIAITFFDEYSNQVGSEIIQINNARPDVPYPFTSTLEMALNRAFSSSSTYVLYADPVTDPPTAPATP